MRAIAVAALLGAVVSASCALPVERTPGGRPVGAPALGQAETLPAPAVEAPVYAEPAPAIEAPAVEAPAVEVRGPWQPPDVPRLPFPRRVERWRPLVHEVMAEEWEHGTLEGHAAQLDDDLVLAVIEQESGGNPRARSWAGAMGLMQVMDFTFALMMAGDEALVPAIDPDAFWDERSNVRAGIRYLALAMQHHDGNVYWSLASYNAGIGTAKRWRLAGLYAVPPVGGYTETADYAQIILRSYLHHRPGLEMYVPDPMPPEHVPGALALLRESRRTNPL